VDDLLVKEGWLVVADLKSQKSGKGEITWETRGTPEDSYIYVVGCVSVRINSYLVGKEEF
jgi:hypothetical protein